LKIDQVKAARPRRADSILNSGDANALREEAASGAFEISLKPSRERASRADERR